MAQVQMTPGMARARVAFLVRDQVTDGAGNFEGAYRERFRRFARVTPMKAGEEVVAARLQGIQPAVIRVRSDSGTRTATEGWRIQDLSNSKNYDIQSIMNVDERNIWLDFTCTSGQSD